MINLTELTKMCAKRGVTMLMWFDDYGQPHIRLERGIWRIEQYVPVQDLVMRRYDQGREIETFVERMLFELDRGVEAEYRQEETKVEYEGSGN